MMDLTQSNLQQQALNDAKSGVKALYLQAASLSGLEATPESPERLAQLTQESLFRVTVGRRPEAVANLLRVIASALMSAQQDGEMILRNHNVEAGLKDVCPVYPFD